MPAACPPSCGLFPSGSKHVQRWRGALHQSFSAFFMTIVRMKPSPEICKVCNGWLMRSLFPHLCTTKIEAFYLVARLKAAKNSWVTKQQKQHC